MKYYIIKENNVIQAETEQALHNLYEDADVFELPEDYELGKYIIGEVDEDIEVPDFETVLEEYEEQATDENGELLYDDEEKPIMETKTREVTTQTGTHFETVKVKKLVPNPNWEQEKAQKERERIAKLSLTKREVFLALYRAKNITPDMIKAQISENTEALIEFEYANDYYRGNPLIDTIGGMLGYTSDDLDYLFEHKEFPAGE